MEKRRVELSKLYADLSKIDKEVTLLLQNLQWERGPLLKEDNLVLCRIDPGHRMPLQCRDEHEKHCLLHSQGYVDGSFMLSDPPDPNITTVVKLGKESIKQIIQKASEADPQFLAGEVPKLTVACLLVYFGLGNNDLTEPMTLDRLQATYTRDERRAIHDAVVATAPTHVEDLTDLHMPSGTSSGVVVRKSRAQVLAELRDMKRRRTKYRAPPKTRNYSDELRHVIQTQMEMYTEVQTDRLMKMIKTETLFDYENNQNKDEHSEPGNMELHHAVPRSLHKSQYKQNYGSHRNKDKNGSQSKNEYTERDKHRNTNRDKERHKHRSSESYRNDSEYHKSGHKSSNRDRNKAENYRSDKGKSYSSKDRRSSRKSKNDEDFKYYDRSYSKEQGYKRYYD